MKRRNAVSWFLAAALLCGIVSAGCDNGTTSDSGGGGGGDGGSNNGGNNNGGNNGGGNNNGGGGNNNNGGNGGNNNGGGGEAYDGTIRMIGFDSENELYTDEGPVVTTVPGGTVYDKSDLNWSDDWVKDRSHWIEVGSVSANKMTLSLPATVPESILRDEGGHLCGWFDNWETGPDTEFALMHIDGEDAEDALFYYSSGTVQDAVIDDGLTLDLDQGWNFIISSAYGGPSRKAASLEELYGLGFKWYLIPYQVWEGEPEGDDGVPKSITVTGFGATTTGSVKMEVNYLGDESTPDGLGGSGTARAEGEGTISGGSVRVHLQKPTGGGAWTGTGGYIIRMTIDDGDSRNLFYYTNGRTFDGMHIHNLADDYKIPRYSIMSAGHSIDFSRFHSPHLD